ncbi:MAG TPA: nitroreductase family protein [Acidimicrobiales bacterium]|jgi:nitroreductase|nr:nitroreductase family protein [Acidimicrobiales bacterium]
MDVRDALRRRRMTRAFDGSELDESQLIELCTEALRAPTAGHARGVWTVVLPGRAGVHDYLAAATDAGWRASSSRAPSLAMAGGAVVVVCDPGTYATRYADDDKTASGLGDLDAWPLPYWYTDAAFATMSLLLLAEDAGLSACFLGAFRHHREVLALVNAPSGTELFGTVLVGRAAATQAPSASLQRPGPTRAERVVRRQF